MHPQAATLWRGPLWTLALLLAALSSLGPFAIDTYLPAFPGMAADLSAERNEPVPLPMNARDISEAAPV